MEQDEETKHMLKSIRELLSEATQDVPANRHAKQSPFKSSPKKVLRKKANKESKNEKSRFKLEKEIDTKNEVIKRDEAALKTISLPFMNSIFLVEKTLELMDDENRAIAEKADSVNRNTVTNTLQNENLLYKYDSIRHKLNVDYFRNRYPRFCQGLKLKQNDIITTRPRSDIWLVRTIEECYDEAMSACNKSVGNSRKRIRYGLDLGALDSFPMVLKRYIARLLSVMDIRDRYTLDLLVTLEYASTESPSGAAAAAVEVAYASGMDPSVNSHRATLFSRFLSEEWDVDTLAVFLHHRDLLQRHLCVRLKDLAQPRVWGDLTENYEQLAKQPGGIAILPDPHGAPSVGGGAQGREGMSTNTKLKGRLQQDVNKNRATQTTITAPVVHPANSARMPFVTLPASLRFAEDLALPEAPMVSILFEGFLNTIGTLVANEGSTVGSTSTSTVLSHALYSVVRPEGGSGVGSSASTSATGGEGRGRALRNHLVRRVLRRVEELKTDSLKSIFNGASAGTKKAILKHLRKASYDSRRIGGRRGDDFEGRKYGIFIGNNTYVVPVVAILLVVCEEWQAVPAETKARFGDAGQSLESLRLLHDIYSGNGGDPRTSKETIREIEGNLDRVQKEAAQCEAQILKLDKLRRRLERRWEEDCATADDLLTLQDTRVKITEAKTNKVAIANRMKFLEKQKKTMNTQMDVLWDTALATSDITAAAPAKKGGAEVVGVPSWSVSSWREKTKELLQTALWINMEKEAAKGDAQRALEESLGEESEQEEEKEQGKKQPARRRRARAHRLGASTKKAEGREEASDRGVGQRGVALDISDEVSELPDEESVAEGFGLDEEPSWFQMDSLVEDGEGAAVEGDVDGTLQWLHAWEDPSATSAAYETRVEVEEEIPEETEVVQAAGTEGGNGGETEADRIYAEIMAAMARETGSSASPEEEVPVSAETKVGDPDLETVPEEHIPISDAFVAVGGDAGEGADVEDDVVVVDEECEEGGYQPGLILTVPSVYEEFLGEGEQPDDIELELPTDLVPDIFVSRQGEGGWAAEGVDEGGEASAILREMARSEGVEEPAELEDMAVGGAVEEVDEEVAFEEAVAETEEVAEVEEQPGLVFVPEEDPEEIEHRRIPHWIPSSTLLRVELLREGAIARAEGRLLRAGFQCLRLYSPQWVGGALSVGIKNRLKSRVWGIWRRLYEVKKASRMWTVLSIVTVKAFRGSLKLVRARHHLQQLEMRIIRFANQNIHQRFRKAIGKWHKWAHKRARSRELYEDMRIRDRYISFVKWRRVFLHHHSISLAAALRIQRFYRRKRDLWKYKSSHAARTIQIHMKYLVHHRRLREQRWEDRRALEVERSVEQKALWKLQRAAWQYWRHDYRFHSGIRWVDHIYRRKRTCNALSRWRSVNSDYNLLLYRSAVKIQSVVRMSVTRHTVLHYHRFRRGLARLQAVVRGVAERRRYAWHLYYHRAAVTIQRAYRGYRTRSNLFHGRVLDIHDAAEANDYDRLLFYAKHAPDMLQELDVYGNTALHNAVKTAAKRTIKLLLKMKMDPNVRNSAGYTPLHLLIGSEAPGRDALLHYLLERGFNEDIATPDGKSCLLLACYYGHEGLAESFLKEHNLDPHVPDDNGTTCLQIAATHGHYKIVETLLSYGTDPHQAGYGGATPLHSVAHSGNVDIGKLLVSYGAYVNAADAQGQTPLMYACQQGFVDLAHFFIMECGANVSAGDLYGRKAVHHAALSNHSPVLHTLREAEANFDDQDSWGNTALHLAAEQGFYDVVKTLLQEGAYSSIQNHEGDQPLHIAARHNHVSVMRMLVAYDKHIGRVNYKHQTPLGVAKFYGAKDAQAFLEEQFYREQEAEVRDEEGNIWWDRFLDVMVEGWRVEVNPLGVREYVNDTTGERQFTPPTLSSNEVWSAAEFAEVPLKRIVQREDEEKLHTIQNYLEHVDNFNDEVETLRRETAAAIMIQKHIRRRLSHNIVSRQKALVAKYKRITRFLCRTAPRFRRWKRKQRYEKVTKLQALWRGYKCRLYMNWGGGLYEKWYRKHGRRLARYVTRAWVYYKYNRLARLTSFLMNAPKTSSAWKRVLEDAGRPRRIVGMHEEYLYPNTYDIYFYRNMTTGKIFLGKPAQIEDRDRLLREEMKEIAKYGYTLAQNRLSIRLQALWRGYHVRSYDLLVRRAVRISQTAEALYFSNPNLDKNIINYALYTHIYLRDYTKARVVYTEALRRMVFRGPDVAFILYAYAVFAFVSHEQDVVDCLHMIERGRAAEEVRAIAKYPDKEEEIRKSVENKTFKYGAVFHLADVGFYKHAAVTGFCREGWHNYAACRFLVYDDYYGAMDAFLAAFRYDPGDKTLNSNFHTMMAHYHGSDKLKINEIIRARMRDLAQKAYDVKLKKESRMENVFIMSLTTLRIQRWYRRWHAKRKRKKRLSLHPSF